MPSRAFSMRKGSSFLMSYGPPPVNFTTPASSLSSLTGVRKLVNREPGKGTKLISTSSRLDHRLVVPGGKYRMSLPFPSVALYQLSHWSVFGVDDRGSRLPSTKS